MNEQDIPIDIHSNKLLDWLISRRHCNKNWHDKILIVREKINNAIQDMPAHEGIVKLLSGSHINYFHCLKIIEILKETEADSKNIFGRYGSQRMKDWQEIVQLYQQDNIYLAEAAQIMIRNINYEVPCLKKQIAKLEQTQNECEKKEKEYAKSENISRGEFNNSCKQLGISGKVIKQELIALLEELPQIYEKIGNNFKSLSTVLELYSEFCRYISLKETNNECLPLLKYVIDNGNTTTYEWMYGEKPEIIENHPIAVPAEENPNLGDNAIDWDTDEIDFDISVEESGIEVEESGITVEESGIEVEETDNSKDKMLTILDNPKTRNQIIDDLMELESFLKMRLFEMSSENDLLTISQLQNAPTALQMQSFESITSMLDSVQVILTELTNKRTSHLHNIKHSPKYLDLLVDSLKQKLSVVEKMQISRKIVLKRVEEARQQTRDIQPLIVLVVEKTKILQEQIETEISKKYKNRIVHIVGGINAL